MAGVVRYLKWLGVQNVGRFVSRLPPVLGYDVETNLVPKVRRTAGCLPDPYPALLSGTVLPQGERNRGIPYPVIFSHVFLWYDPCGGVCGCGTCAAVVSAIHGTVANVLIACGLVETSIVWDGIHVSMPFLYPLYVSF